MIDMLIILKKRKYSDINRNFNPNLASIISVLPIIKNFIMQNTATIKIHVFLGKGARFCYKK